MQKRQLLITPTPTMVRSTKTLVMGTGQLFQHSFQSSPFQPFHSSSVTASPPGNTQPTQLPLFDSTSLSGQLGSSRPQGQGEKANEEDNVELLNEWELLELVQFDRTLEDKNAWEAGEIINSIIGKHLRYDNGGEGGNNEGFI